MAANKFATMLHRNTHKITVILVYTLLEWVLILLLLLNSLFSFLITKFANYFGLKPPCLWCSRLDHILDPNKTKNSYKDLVCETHANEISKLSYCPNHQKLAESHNLCMDCVSTQPKCNKNSTEISRRIAFFTWVSENKFENGDQKTTSKCSCCEESLSSNIYPFNLLFKPSWEVLENTPKANLITETLDEYSDTCKSDSSAEHVNNDHDIERKKEDEEEKVEDEHQILSDVESFSFEAAVDEKADPNSQEHESSRSDSSHRCPDAASIIQTCFDEDESLQLMNLPPLGYGCRDFDRLRPVELIDSSTVEEDLVGILDHLNGDFDSEPWIESQVQLVEEASLHGDSAEKARYGVVEAFEISGIENFSILVVEQMIEDLLVVTCEQLIVTQVSQTSCISDNNVEATTIREPDNPQGEEEDAPANQTQAKEPTLLPCLQVDQSSMQNKNVKISTSSNAFIFGNDLGSKQIEKATIQERKVLDDKNHEEVNQNLSAELEANEVEEDKLSDAANYMEGLHHLHKKLLVFDKRESGAEESWDGSVVSEVECGDGVLTVERLKSALRAERKALCGLYAELEAERSAAAIAANQTMAMITRLQEEKAAMQMEALQYQRMMEEQSEYDQEALQLLNELMTKRENEKQELEKELEMYRKKVLEYEAKERMLRRKDGSFRSRTSSASCSNAAEDVDELSIDLNRDRRDEDDSFCGHQDGDNNNAPADEVPNLGEIVLDCVKDLSTLDESMAEFEEERLSILEELKALEEKLFTLADEEGHTFEDVKPIEHFTHDYGKEFCDNYGHVSSPVENEVSNVLSEALNGKDYSENKIIGSKAKRLLPLFDATGVEIGEVESNTEQDNSGYAELRSSLDSDFEVEGKKIPVEEEVDHIYERLQALEANREFLKHCIGSLNKGDKGMDLLQEILQHLRDLKTMEHNVRNIGDSPLF
ncbi:myosin-binding protein 3 isoform X2 [Cornus florida]|uniref:myosin-binding protein 3 isoform X2 n=1 Tax=Cornus florida TaxID=4283 RepID=UPI0028A26C33|nr:myosin-binding protein 3 isoform X2 [Cornus florida]